MGHSVASLIALFLLGLTAEVWAGPAEEVAALAQPRGPAFLEGNLEAWVAAFADNAVFHSAPSPFRIEGKPAIRAHFADLFRAYPERRAFTHQLMTRVYNDDLVISNGYTVLSYTDLKGQITTFHTRFSVTWAKVGGRWQVVDHHISRLPPVP
jgi:uncharacterized protein (TIGR02246 family)